MIRYLFVVLLVWTYPATGVLFASPQADNETIRTAEDTKKFERLADRYWSIVSKRPRQGPTFDQWYRLYLDAGRLADLTKRVENEARAQAKSFPIQFLYGLVLQRAGNAKAALAQYQLAAKLDPDKYSAHVLAGDLHNRAGRNKEAIRCYRNALQCVIPQIELSGIYRKLGRIQLQQQDSAAALKTFADYADRFPDDKRVLKEVARLLAAESQFDAAIERWQQVLKLAANDPFEKAKANLSIADLQMKQGDQPGAVQRLTAALGSARPDGWVARDIRTRIESAFLEKNDSEKLINWTRDWFRKNPDDPQASLHLAKVLSRFGTAAETLQTYEAALKRQPDNAQLRIDYIHELDKREKHSEAIAACEELVRQQPNNADALTLAGEVILKPFANSYTFSEEFNNAQKDALRYWSRIADLREDDPLLAIRVANMCRESIRLETASRVTDATSERRRKRYTDVPMAAAAEKFYREAIRRQPATSEYNEFLGEFLYATGRTQSALEVLKRVVPESSTRAGDWQRLAGLLQRFGFLEQATNAANNAVKFDRFSYSAREQLAGLLLERRRYSEALSTLEELLPLAKSAVREKGVIAKMTDAFFESGRPAEAARECRLKADDDTLSPAERIRNLRLLASIYDRQNTLRSAADALGEAVKLKPNDPRLLESWAELLQRTQQIEKAIRAYNHVAKFDRNARVRTGLKIAQMQFLRRNREAAASIVRRLMSPPPTRSDYVQQLVSLAGQLNLKAESVELLQQLLKLDPSNVTVRLQLADLLSAAAEEHTNLEAMEHYRRALFDADEMDDRLNIVERMAMMARSVKAVDSLLEELGNLPLTDRERGLILAQVHLTNNNRSGARIELRRLLKANPRDILLLERLAELEFGNKSYLTAAEYRSRLADLTRDPETLRQLARDYELGEKPKLVTDTVLRLLREHDDDSFIVAQAEKLIVTKTFEPAEQLISAARKERPDNLNLIYLSGVLNLIFHRSSEAQDDFQRVIESAQPGSGSLFATRSEKSSAREAQLNNLLNIARRDRLTEKQFLNSTSSLFNEFAYARLARTIFLTLGQLKQTNFRLQDGERQIGLSLAIAERPEEKALFAAVFMHELDSDSFAKRFASRADTTQFARLSILMDTVAGRLPNAKLIGEQFRQAPADSVARLALFYNRLPKQVEDSELLLARVRDAWTWLNNNVPDQAAELSANYMTQLIRLGAHEEARDILMADLETKKTTPQLAEILKLASETKQPDLHTAAIKRAAVHSQQPALPSSKIRLLLDAALQNPSLITNWDDQRESILLMARLYFQRADATTLTGTTRLPNIMSTYSSTQLRTAASTAGEQILKLQRNRDWRESREARFAAESQVRAIQESLSVLTIADTNYRTFPPMHRLLPEEAQLRALQDIAQQFELADKWVSGRFFINPFFERRISRIQQDLLDEFLKQSRPTGSDHLRSHDRMHLAHACLLWWYGKDQAAQTELRKLADSQRERKSPLENDTRAALAVSHLLSEKPLLALEELNRIRATALEFPNAYGFRHLVHGFLVHGKILDPEILRLELQAVDPPTLGTWFTRNAATPQSFSTLSTPGRSIASQTSRVRTNKNLYGFDANDYPHPAGPMKDVIAKLSAEQARELAALAEKRYQQREDAHTALLISCLSIQAGQTQTARRAFENWKRLSPKVSQSRKVRVREVVPMHLIAHFAKQQPELVDLAVDVVAEIATGTASAMNREPLRRQIRNLVVGKAGVVNQQRCQEFAKRLISHTNRVPLYFRTPAGEFLLECLPTNVVAPVLTELFQSDAAPLDWKTVMASTLSFRRSVCLALESSVPELKKEQASELLPIMEAVVFPDGAKQPPKPRAWQRRQNKYMHAGAVVQQVVQLAKQAGELEELRKRWAQHPQPNHPAMLLCRIEAADVARDESDAEKLIQLFSKTENPNGIRPWSDAIRSRTNPDYYAVELAISNGNLVWIEPFERVHSLTQIPERTFHVNTIRMNGSALDLIRSGSSDDADSKQDLDGETKLLSQIPRLKRLKSLAVFHVPLTDEHVELIAESRSLEKLILDSTPQITDASANALSGMTSLKSLRLTSTSLTTAAIAKLRAALPNCRITN